jgi:hypothetical protein
MDILFYILSIEPIHYPNTHQPFYLYLEECFKSSELNCLATFLPMEKMFSLLNEIKQVVVRRAELCPGCTKPSAGVSYFFSFNWWFQGDAFKCVALSFFSPFPLVASQKASNTLIVSKVLSRREKQQPRVFLRSKRQSAAW